MLCGCSAVVGGIHDVADPPKDFASPNLNIYRNYILESDSEPSFIYELILYPDHKVYKRFDVDERQSFWSVSNDTLYIFFDYNSTCNNKTSLYCDVFERIGISRKDSKYPGNVNAFKIINHGDSIYAIDEVYGYKGYAISKKAAREEHGHKYRFTGVGGVIPTCWRDSLKWEPKHISQTGIFLVKVLQETDSMNLSVIISKSNVDFDILNPKLYSQTQALPFASLPEYSDWIDSVNVGDSIALELFRPAYDAEVFERSPYLSASPDTVYVLDGDVYGYWFARPLSTSK